MRDPFCLAARLRSEAARSLEITEPAVSELLRKAVVFENPAEGGRIHVRIGCGIARSVKERDCIFTAQELEAAHPAKLRERLITRARAVSACIQDFSDLRIAEGTRVHS
jgi:hypothetical protein